MYIPHLTRRALQVRHPVLRRPMFTIFLEWVFDIIFWSSPLIRESIRRARYVQSWVPLLIEDVG